MILSAAGIESGGNTSNRNDQAQSYDVWFGNRCAIKQAARCFQGGYGKRENRQRSNNVGGG